MLTRRKFLSASIAGTFLLQAAPLALSKTSVSPLAEVTPQSRRMFPQGVASADPQSDRLMLWTRISPREARGLSAVIRVQLSPDSSFREVLVDRNLAVNKAQDYTLRTIVSGLEPATDYFYRFITADGISSRTGRTWTAPADDSSPPVTIAFASCQGYPPKKYGAYRHLISSEQRDPGSRPDFVLHLGDYIYGLNPKRDGIDLGPVSTDEMGAPLSDPFDLALEGQRRLYRLFLEDSDLQDARALYPFVCIWDDHEFANDPWQSYIAGVGSRPQKRLAASQAWFEFVPQILSQSRDVPGAANEAYDYQVKELEDVPMENFGDGFVSLEPNNMASITALATYRSVRWGRLVDTLVTDNRLYRGPGANPGYTEALISSGSGSAKAFSQFELHNGELLKTLAQGREANGGNPPETINVEGELLPNTRRESPAVSMLGPSQKDWFKRALKGSDAKWKVWANAMPIMGFKFDLGSLSDDLSSGYLWTDGWDGFPNERAEMMEYLLEEGIENVVSLSGDRHAHYAGLVAVDYEAKEHRYVIPDFTCSAISAFARGPFLSRQLKKLGVAQLAQSPSNDVGVSKAESTLNFMMRHGAVAADRLAQSGDPEDALRSGPPSPNPHLLYADNNVNGYCVARFSEDAMECDFVGIVPRKWDQEALPEGPEALRVVRFRVESWRRGKEPELQRLPTLGTAPFGET